jgi:hypothetical protein
MNSALMDEVDQMLADLQQLRERCSQVVGKRIAYLRGDGTRQPAKPDNESVSVLDDLNAAGEILPINMSKRKVAAILDDWAYDFVDGGEEAWLDFGDDHPLMSMLERISKLSNEENPDEVEEFELPHLSHAMLGRLPTLPKMQDLFVLYNEAMNSGKHKRVEEPYEACIHGILDCIQAFLEQGEGSGSLTKSAKKT